MAPPNQQEFLAFLATQLDKSDGLKPEQTLADVPEWDSLAMVMFVANADAEFGVAVDGNAVAAAATVDDLYQLVKS